MLIAAGGNSSCFLLSATQSIAPQEHRTALCDIGVCEIKHTAFRTHGTIGPIFTASPPPIEASQLTSNAALEIRPLQSLGKGQNERQKSLPEDTHPVKG